MAAIFGVNGNISEQELEGMTQRLAHRGRFSKLYRVNELITLGIRSSDEKEYYFKTPEVSVVAVGSIYNIEDFRQLLAGKGCPIQGTSLAELIGKLFSLYGTKKFHEINGDFSFAIWDHNQSNLILCRDYFGLYPLYYTPLTDGAIAFASEYKSLLALSTNSPEIDLNMIQHLQCSKRLPIGNTLFKDIQAIPPGTPLTFTPQNSIPQITDQFPPIKVEVTEVNEDKICTDLKNLLSKALECRISDTKEIGITLSGGIDSIGIACLCRNMYPDRKIHTFSAGYGENDTDLSTAKLVAEFIGSTHHEVYTPPSLMEKNTLHKLVWHLEDPFSRSESLQLHTLASKAQKYVTSLISGQGADGLFAGMPKYKLIWYMKKYPWLKAPLADIYLFTQISQKPKTIIGNILKAIYFRGSVPYPPSVIGASETPKPFVFPEIGSAFINDIAAKGFQIGVCQDIQKFERNFAGFGMMYQSPFYDLRLVRKCFTIPDKLKICQGIQKYIFRQSFKGVVPDKFLQVPKLPQRMNYDMEFSHKLNRLADQYLNKKSIEQRGFFEYSQIDRLIKKQLNKPYSAEWSMRLWTAILTEIWAIEFIDNKGVGSS